MFYIQLRNANQLKDNLNSAMKISWSSVQTVQVDWTMSDTFKPPNTFFKNIMSAFAQAPMIHNFSYSSVEEKSRGAWSIPHGLHAQSTEWEAFHPGMTPLHHRSVVEPHSVDELDLKCSPAAEALTNPVACQDRQFLSQQTLQRTWKLLLPTVLQRHFTLGLSQHCHILFPEKLAHKMPFLAHITFYNTN
jgi:hypothetical protein